jgi:hypothetical protein
MSARVRVNRMPYPNQRFQDKSFLWAFLLFGILVLVSRVWGTSIGLSAFQAHLALVAAGLIPLLIQLITGYSLDSAWVTRYSYATNPIRYGIGLIVWIVLTCMFAFWM